MISSAACKNSNLAGGSGSSAYPHIYIQLVDRLDLIHKGGPQHLNNYVLAVIQNHVGLEMQTSHCLTLFWAKSQGLTVTHPNLTVIRRGPEYTTKDINFTIVTKSLILSALR